MIMTGGNRGNDNGEGRRASHEGEGMGKNRGKVGGRIEEGVAIGEKSGRVRVGKR